MLNIAINGFGRIGRMVFRKLIQDELHSVVAINASYSPEQLAHLVRFDTVHGIFPFEVYFDEQFIYVNGSPILILHERNPEKLPWKELKIDIVVESTGAFLTKETVGMHITAGAKKAILTAPSKDDMKTIVIGVNEMDYQNETVVSNASCTTNCLAPITKVINDNFGVKSGFMTTVHALTNDQNIIDNPHNDLRRARAAGMNMVPTSTGAAKAIGIVLPSLKGKMNGLAIRVPTVDVSLVDVVFELNQKVTKEEVNNVLKNAAEKIPGILDYNELPLVSSDYKTNSKSATVDGLSTMVLDDKVKILAWYDNEWGYSCRVVELISFITSSEPTIQKTF